MEGDYRILRRSFGQKLKDQDLPIAETSRVMGHMSTQVTEKYYARVRSKLARERAEAAWEGRLSVSARPPD